MRRHHLALVALFVALGGTAYASTALPSNSVGTAQLRRGAVTSSKLHADAVTSASIRPGAVGTRQLSRPLRTLLGRSSPTVVAYGDYRQPRPCVPSPSAVCPALLTVTTKLDRAMNVTLADNARAAEDGIVCLSLASGLDASQAVVVTAPTDGSTPIAGTSSVATDHADWMPTAPDCSQGQLEIDTYYVTSDSGGLHKRAIGIPFSFVVL